MKISAKDEYGLRILLRIARHTESEGITIARISEAEGLSEPYVAKITRMLRLSGFVQSTRGTRGGYVLSKPANEIRISEVLRALDGALYDESFCSDHSGKESFCNNSVGCSVRSLWRMLQGKIDQILDSITVADLIGDTNPFTAHHKIRTLRTPATTNG
ncbi:MAG: Rrf2 family transcriptional regulator [Saprospiraceae bacterium]|nr:Rrf2 family transcriptional regulator [Saprospiraceae bacterium]